MGTWNGYTNYQEWADHNAPPKECEYCGKYFTPRSGSQRYCHQEDNPECAGWRWIEGMSKKQWKEYCGPYYDPDVP